MGFLFHAVILAVFTWRPRTCSNLPFALQQGLIHDGLCGADVSPIECALEHAQKQAIARTYADAEDFVVESSNMIKNSNRVGKNSCSCEGGEPCVGQECKYSCDDGYVAIGEHVYHDAIPDVLQPGFFGGRCVEICTGQPTACDNGQVPIRFLTHSASTCLNTKCVGAKPDCASGKCGAKDMALIEVAKGNWALWQRARSEVSGLYVDNINLNTLRPAWQVGKADATGVGLIMECIAHALGFQTTMQAKNKVLLTLQALSGQVEGVNIVRSTNGHFFPGVMDTNTGSSPKRAGSGNVAASGLLFGGILFTRKYFLTVTQGQKTQEIAALADALFTSTQWDTMMCDGAMLDPNNGDTVAWYVTEDGRCGAPLARIRAGKLPFNEGFVARWLGYEWACNVMKTPTCKNMKKMYDASLAVKVEGKKWDNQASEAPETQILANYGSYVVQLPYYMASPFNSDRDFLRLFRNQWLADKDLYAHSPFFSTSRYGLGAGPTAIWCDKTGYKADTFPNPGQCLTYTTDGVVGYIPVGGQTVLADILKMLADGEAVEMVPDPITRVKYPVLGRRMMTDPEWEPYAATMIDLGAELFGIAAHVLGTEFFETFTNHANLFGDISGVALMETNAKNKTFKEAARHPGLMQEKASMVVDSAGGINQDQA